MVVVEVGGNGDDLNDLRKRRREKRKKGKRREEELEVTSIGQTIRSEYRDA
jgi:hypothetical protein